MRCVRKQVGRATTPARFERDELVHVLTCRIGTVGSPSAPGRLTNALASQSTPSYSRQMRPNRGLSFLIVAWACGGVTLLFLQAITRLLPRALEALEGLSASQAIWYAVIVVGLLYTEGYKAFHVQFMPRLVARALFVTKSPTWWRVFLAPFFVMALFETTRKRLIISWAVTIGVVILIIIVQRLPMPWRGMIDAGVVLSLGWGLVRMAQLLVFAALGIRPHYDPEMPLEPA